VFDTLSKAIIHHENETEQVEIPADEHTEMATPEVADEQAVLNIGEQRSETAEAVLEQEDDKAEWGSEIESAAVLNDIPDIEGEQEEQMAWYEYLELEEPANDATRPENAEQSRPEEASSAGSAPDVIASETGTPENYEYTTPNEPVTTLPLVGEERTDEPATALPLESGATEGSNETQGWQIWQAQGTGDETLPLALKEIQFAQQQQNSIAHEESVSETTTRGEEIARDEQNAVEAEVSAIFEASSANLVAKGSEMPVVYTAEIRETQSSLRANEQGALTNSEAEPPAESQTPQWSELVETLQAQSETTSIFAETIAINEESTTTLDEQQAVSSAEDRVETPIEQVVVHTQAEAMLPVQPLGVSAPPPKKPGFWRRLFSFGRKNR
jgi:hypothetical protein